MRQPVLTFSFAVPLALTAALAAQPATLLQQVFPRATANPSANPHSFVQLGQAVHFATDVGIAATDLSGRRVRPFAGSRVHDLQVAGNALFYTYDAGGGKRFGRQSGTTVEILPLPLPEEFLAIGPDALVSAVGTGGRELWITDGTQAGTKQLTELNPGPGGSNPRSFVKHGRIVFFLANDGSNGEELWRTDGTAAGTVLHKDVLPGAASSEITGLVSSGSRLWFIARNATGGHDLWTSDGTTAGTRSVAAAEPHTTLTPLGPGAVFVRDTGVDRRLWISDGTTAGTRAVARIAASGPHRWGGRPVQIGNTLYLVVLDPQANGVLWRTDGTPAGTRRVTPVAMTVPPSSNLATLGLRVFYSGSTGAAHEAELWATDGTTNTRVADIRPGREGSGPTELTTVGNRIFFQADDGRHGREAWITDGTAAGTKFLGNVHNWGVGAAMPQTFAAGGRVWFFVNDNGTSTLWATDGTPAGTTAATAATVPASNNPQRGVFAGAGRIFFGSPGPAGQLTDLWTTDGTAAGTKLVRKDVGMFTSMLDMGSYALFNGGAFGHELWRTDGTAAGTLALGASVSTFRLASVERFARAGERGYFLAQGEVLWSTDGSPRGTNPVAAVANLRAKTAPVVYGGNLLFVDFQNRLIVTDGTAGGTRILSTQPVRVFENVRFLGSNSRGVFFTIFAPSFGQPSTLYVTDGTAAGTKLLATSPNAVVFDSAVFRDRLQLSWGDGATGIEPWVSDGTALGTYMLQDLQPGPGSSLGGGGAATGDRFLYFNATPDGRTFRLYRFDDASLTLANELDTLLSRPRQVGGRLVTFGIDPVLGAQLFAIRLPANTAPAGLGCAAGIEGTQLTSTDPALSTLWQMTLSSPHAQSPVVFLLGTAASYRTALRIGGCTIAADLSRPFLPIVSRTDAAGRATLAARVQPPSLLGLTFVAQAAVGTSATAFGTDLSNALRIEVGR